MLEIILSLCFTFCWPDNIVEVHAVPILHSPFIDYSALADIREEASFYARLKHGSRIELLEMLKILEKYEMIPTDISLEGLRLVIDYKSDELNGDSLRSIVIIPQEDAFYIDENGKQFLIKGKEGWVKPLCIVEEVMKSNFNYFFSNQTYSIDH